MESKLCKYNRIVFDIDGTLVDTAHAMLHSLQDSLKQYRGLRPDIAELEFALAMPGREALRFLRVPEIDRVYEIWCANLEHYRHTMTPFTGVETLLENLSKQGKHLGIITSKTRAQYRQDFEALGLGKYFHTVICLENAERPKPSAAPMLKYLQQIGAKPQETIYIGDSPQDEQCAHTAGVAFLPPVWNNKF